MTGDDDHGPPAPERWNHVFDLLSSDIRRVLVYNLVDVAHDTWLPLPDAAHSENQSLDRHALSVQLRHHHLPKLADRGHVRWRRDPFGAKQGPAFHEVGKPLDLVMGSVDELPAEMIRGCVYMERLVDNDWK